MGETFHYIVEAVFGVIVTILSTVLAIVWRGKADAGETAVSIAAIHGQLEVIRKELTELHTDFRIYTGFYRKEL